MTYVDIEDMGVKPKLVLYCYLVPQLDTTIVRLTNSTPLFTSNPQTETVINNATVEISKNNMEWVKLDFVYSYYMIAQSHFPIQEGETYYIRASAPEYETVYASCTVPYLRETNVSIVLKDTIYSNGYFEWTNIQGSFEWTDYAGEDNYYMMCCKFLGTDYHWNWTDTLSYIDTIYYYAWRLFYDRNARQPSIYSDKGLDGRKMLAVAEMYGEQNHILEMKQLQTDIHCYMFQKSTIHYDPDMQFFMLEPTQLYTKSKNGYGVLGAFVMKDCEFEKKKKK
jgi:hypothetical protein